METFGIDDWKRWRQEGCARLPVMRVTRGERLPSSWAGLNEPPVTALLESALGGRYSYLCDRPSRVILGWSEHAEIRSPDGAALVGNRSGKPLDVLRTLLAETKSPALADWPPMCGGLIGVFGYDLVHAWERLSFAARRDLSLPLYAFVETAELFIYDHAEKSLAIVVWSEVGRSDEAALMRRFQSAMAAAEAALTRWQRTTVFDPPPHAATEVEVAQPGPSFTPDAFQNAVRRVHDYIAAGHTYQVNLSLRTSRATPVSATAIYDSLRRVNPSPYMGLLRLPEFALVCGSPELLVRLVDGVVSSRPIAGTRPRGVAPPQDSHFSVELKASEKERAEHLMLVDLIRNDIGRVAAFGSVHVPEFMAVERYSHVMHLVSQVEGRLADGKSWTHVLEAMFPGGTITGCPKIRTMEIIEELEPVGRGFYTGALGWISYGGEMELNIVIRSMLLQAGLAHVQAGAGIVADSQPDRELDEALRKARALWVALDQAEAAAAIKTTAPHHG